MKCVSYARNRRLFTSVMRQFNQMVEGWREEGPIKLATNATITAMENAGIPKAEQAAIIEDRDIIMKYNTRLCVISEIFGPAITKLTMMLPTHRQFRQN